MGDLHALGLLRVHRGDGDRIGGERVVVGAARLGRAGGARGLLLLVLLPQAPSSRPATMRTPARMTKPRHLVVGFFTVTSLE